MSTQASSARLTPARKRHVSILFSVHDGVELPDDEGVELASLKEAREEAIRYAGNVIADNAKRMKLDENWAMEVTDDAGLLLLRLDFLVKDAAPAKVSGSEHRA